MLAQALVVKRLCYSRAKVPVWCASTSNRRMVSAFAIEELEYWTTTLASGIQFFSCVFVHFLFLV